MATLKNSAVKGTKAKSTFFRVVFPASLSVSPGTCKARMMTVTSGLRCLEFAEKSGHDLWWLKTFLASLSWKSTTCLMDWRVKATPAGRPLLYLRARLVQTISGREFGWLPTPVATDAKQFGMVARKTAENRIYNFQLNAVHKLLLRTNLSSALMNPFYSLVRMGFPRHWIAVTS